MTSKFGNAPPRYKKPKVCRKKHDGPKAVNLNPDTLSAFVRFNPPCTEPDGTKTWFLTLHRLNPTNNWGIVQGTLFDEQIAITYTIDPITDTANVSVLYLSFAHVSGGFAANDQEITDDEPGAWFDQEIDGTSPSTIGTTCRLTITPQ